MLYSFRPLILPPRDKLWYLPSGQRWYRLHDKVNYLSICLSIYLYIYMCLAMGYTQKLWFKRKSWDFWVPYSQRNPYDSSQHSWNGTCFQWNSNFSKIVGEVGSNLIGEASTWRIIQLNTWLFHPYYGWDKHGETTSGGLTWTSHQRSVEDDQHQLCRVAESLYPQYATAPKHDPSPLYTGHLTARLWEHVRLLEGSFLSLFNSQESVARTLMVPAKLTICL